MRFAKISFFARRRIHPSIFTFSFFMINSRQLQICLQQLSKQKQIMEIFFNVESHPNQQAGCGRQVFLYSSEGQDHLIDMYLSQEVFYQQELQRISQVSDESIEKHDSKTQHSQPKTQQSIPFAKNVKKHKKSIFHNFQKHLISTIKKYMSFNKNRFGDLLECDVAYQLWHAFMKTSSFNKRLLHIVFGVETDRPTKSGFQRLWSEFGQFKKIYEQFGDQLILRAQKMIRNYVVQESHHISKAFLRSNSNITKFEEFYGYYSQFIAEIQCGAMPKRMKKTSKQTLINNLKSKKAK